MLQMCYTSVTQEGHMDNRRDFFKSIIASGVALGMGGGAVARANNQGTSCQFPPPKGFARKTTIFAQCGNPEMLAALSWEANHLGCDIYHGQPFSPDIIAVPYFVALINRKTIEAGRWADFLEFRKEVGDTTPLIIVDEFGDSKGWAIDQHMQIRDPKNPDDVRYIIAQIKDAFRAAQD
jgi:hypothetical protein